MKVEYLWIAAIVVVGAGSYSFGQERGLKKAPSYVAFMKEQDRKADAWSAEFDVLYAAKPCDESVEKALEYLHQMEMDRGEDQ